MHTDLETLTKIVKLAAQEELLPGFGNHEFSYKEDDSIITAADTAMQLRLQTEMADVWPDIPVLGEEMSVDQQHTVIDRGKEYWCIDPLDGTNNYATGMPCFAVSIALVRNAETVLALIHDPIRDETFTAIKGEGAHLNGALLNRKPAAEELHRVIAEIDMKRLPRELCLRLVTEAPYSSQRNIGSSALEWCWLAAGRYNIYLHGGQKLWDYAAGHLVLHEAGGVSISLDNLPVFRNQLETRSVLASLDADLFQYWKEWIGIV
ncbi:MAG: inositol monophosphatase family protein [Gammaproteobacteria bacterium]